MDPKSDASGKGSPAVSASLVNSVKKAVESDKGRGMEVVKMAGQQVRDFKILSFPTDITGKPNPNERYAKDKKEELRGLEAISRKPFYRRVNVRFEYADEVEDMAILISESRGAGGRIDGDGWMVVSYSGELGTQLEGKRPGAKVVVKTKHATTVYEVLEATKYELLLPQFVNGEFLFKTGSAAFAAEADLEAEAPPAASLAELPSTEYVAKATFGLSDIIVFRDDPQIAAMAIPFDQSVVIDGPPGSGKTSIGLMRIVSLLDRQWDILNITRGKDRPFHDHSTMKVLVYNDEMVEYLKSLVQSIGIEHVQVSTTHDFLRRICQRTRLLTGTARRDKSSLALMKGRREVLKAYFAGFKAHAIQHWELGRHTFREALFKLGPDYLTLADRFADWIARISAATINDERIDGSIGIADGLTAAADAIRQGRSSTRRAVSPSGDLAPSDQRMSLLSEDGLQKGLVEAKKLVEDMIRGICSRAGATITMFGLPEYQALKQSLVTQGVAERVIEDADRLWRKQYKGALPAYSELDLAMLSWLAAKVLLSQATNRKPWVGGQMEPLTHLVVDEVQDLSPSHLAILAAQVSSNGTMTLVGDIHQNLNPYAGLRRWDEIPIPNIRRANFSVNHRQTKQLGTFVKSLHSGLYQSDCTWDPSAKTVGELPRVGTSRSWRNLVNAIAEEARYWRQTIQGNGGATVAVLYDGRIKPKRLEWLQSRLSNRLSDDGTPVELVLPGASGEPLRRTDRVVIASVRQTKGLEFDAVVFVEAKARWAKPVDDVDVRIRNGLYVAASRARAGLSLCMSNLPACVAGMISSGLCEQVSWVAKTPSDGE